MAPPLWFTNYVERVQKDEPLFTAGDGLDFGECTKEVAMDVMLRVSTVNHTIDGWLRDIVDELKRVRISYATMPLFVLWRICEMGWVVPHVVNVVNLVDAVPMPLVGMSQRCRRVVWKLPLLYRAYAERLFEADFGVDPGMPEPIVTTWLDRLMAGLFARRMMQNIVRFRSCAAQWDVGAMERWVGWYVTGYCDRGDEAWVRWEAVQSAVGPGVHVLVVDGREIEIGRMYHRDSFRSDNPQYAAIVDVPWRRLVHGASDSDVNWRRGCDGLLSTLLLGLERLVMTGELAARAHGSMMEDTLEEGGVNVDWLVSWDALRRRVANWE